MPEIRPVTKENWQTLIGLKVREDQRHFVASNLYSIAQAQFGDEFEGYWDLFPYGIYDSDTPVGFLMVVLGPAMTRDGATLPSSVTLKTETEWFMSLAT